MQPCTLQFTSCHPLFVHLVVVFLQVRHQSGSCVGGVLQLAIHVAMHVEFASHVGFAGRTMAVAELVSRSDDHHP